MKKTLFWYVVLFLSFAKVQAYEVSIYNTLPKFSQEYTSSKTKKEKINLVKRFERRDEVFSAYYNKDNNALNYIDKLMPNYLNSLDENIIKFPPLCVELKKLIRESEVSYQKKFNLSGNFKFYLWTSIYQSDAMSFWKIGEPSIALNVNQMLKYEPKHLKLIVSQLVFNGFRMANFKNNLPTEKGYSVMQSRLMEHGLATLVSHKMLPQFSEKEIINVCPLAMHNYKLYTNNKTKILNYVKQNIHQSKPDHLAVLFEARDNKQLPAMSGYYVGYKLALEMSKKMSLKELIRLSPDQYIDRMMVCLSNINI